MAVKIQKPIVDYRVIKVAKGDASVIPATAESSAPKENENLIAELASISNVIHMHERFPRPERLKGRTYKIKTPLSEHALYVTINDMLVNPNTPYERRRPYEIFINSKNMDHFQWIVALTRIISAVFRKGGDVIFLVEELQAVFDPRGGYFKQGGKFTPSLVAEIGSVIEEHMKSIGMIVDEPLSESTQAILDEKRKEFERRQEASKSNSDNAFPEGASLCQACHMLSMVLLDGCLTCLNCGESKCS